MSNSTTNAHCWNVLNTEPRHKESCQVSCILLGYVTLACEQAPLGVGCGRGNNWALVTKHNLRNCHLLEWMPPVIEPPSNQGHTTLFTLGVHRWKKANKREEWLAPSLFSTLDMSLLNKLYKWEKLCSECVRTSLISCFLPMSITPVIIGKSILLQISQDYQNWSPPKCN